jgi:hypothetical protein
MLREGGVYLGVNPEQESQGMLALSGDRLEGGGAEIFQNLWEDTWVKYNKRS